MAAGSPHVERPSSRLSLVRTRSIDPDRAVVEWLPAALERLRVKKWIAVQAVDVERALRVEPERLTRLAFESVPADGGRAITLFATKSHLVARVLARLEWSSPSPSESQAVIGLTWRSVRAEHLFPVMSGELFVRSQPTGCELVFEGTYRPPLGLLGLVLDHLVGRRLAVRAAEDFLEGLGAALELVA